MTGTPEAPEAAPTIPYVIEAEAVDLIRSLSAVAGDEARVLDAMRAHAATEGGDITATATVALWLTFARCLPGPVDLPDLTPDPSAPEQSR